MGVFHRATITPSKAELIAAWVPTQSWGPSPDAPSHVVGAYRFDDPENFVGMETHLVKAGDELLHVPLTYRAEALDGVEEAMVGMLQHSELGTRWVYDGLSDERFVTMLAAVAMTGQGEALGMVSYDGRWHIAPTHVRIQGGGWTQERVAVDGFRRVFDDKAAVLYRNDRFELTFFRRPFAGPRPAIGLTATWEGQRAAVVLAEVREF